MPDPVAYNKPAYPKIDPARMKGRDGNRFLAGIQMDKAWHLTGSK